VREAAQMLLIQQIGLPNSDASEYPLAFEQAAAATLEASKQGLSPSIIVSRLHRADQHSVTWLGDGGSGCVAMPH